MPHRLICLIIRIDSTPLLRKNLFICFIFAESIFEVVNIMENVGGKELLTTNVAVNFFIDAAKLFMTAGGEPSINEPLRFDFMRRLKSKKFKTFSRNKALRVGRHSSYFFEMLEDGVCRGNCPTGPYRHRYGTPCASFTCDKLSFYIMVRDLDNELTFWQETHLIKGQFDSLFLITEYWLSKKCHIPSLNIVKMRFMTIFIHFLSDDQLYPTKNYFSILCIKRVYGRLNLFLHSFSLIRNWSFRCFKLFSSLCHSNI